MGTDACILCGAMPPPPLTEEHVWPTWYSNTLPDDLRMKFSGTINGKDYEWRAQKLNIAPTCLCKPCNHEWGSTRLEVPVSKFLGPMAKGEPTDLTLPKMQRLAAWLTLKCMVLDCIRSDEGEWFYTQDQRRFLRRTLRPPHDTCLWIGKYSGASAMTGRADELRSLSAAPSGKVHDAWTVAFSIGKVAFQLHAIQGLNPAHGPAQVEQSAYDWDKTMYPLWPLPERPFRWPPEIVVDEAGWFMALSRFFDTPGAHTSRRKRRKP
jgi:hypothetical protein